MIKEVEGSIFDNLPEYSVVIHQCNTKGWIGLGISKEIAKRWPESFEKYHGYCRWFQDGHENEILGTFVGYNASPTLIICNAITQRIIGKSTQQTDYDAWENICKTLERQTRRVNKVTGKNWTLHIQHKNCSSLSGGLWENTLEIFERYFTDSPVELVIHNH